MASTIFISQVTCPLFDQSTPVELLRALGHVQRRVELEKVRRLERDRDDLDRHDGEVLDSGVVRHAERVPDDDVLVDRKSVV